MDPTVKVVCDSRAPNGVRLTTIEATFHRVLLAEVNTHRAFSRNSASSRAIPLAKLRKLVEETPAFPLFWGKNQSGMQAREELDSTATQIAKYEWEQAAYHMLLAHRRMEEIGLHKQWTNRLLEPWLPHTAVISATRWKNFFDQRDHPDAMPEFGALAAGIKAAINASKPELVPMGGYHLPYVNREEKSAFGLEHQIKTAIARCARVSYLRQGQEFTLEQELSTHGKMESASPKHWSPFEHVATPLESKYDRWGNFHGWKQEREMEEYYDEPEVY